MRRRGFIAMLIMGIVAKVSSVIAKPPAPAPATPAEADALYRAMVEDGLIVDESGSIIGRSYR